VLLRALCAVTETDGLSSASSSGALKSSSERQQQQQQQQQQQVARHVVHSSEDRTAPESENDTYTVPDGASFYRRGYADKDSSSAAYDAGSVSNLNSAAKGDGLDRNEENDLLTALETPFQR
jgi:hypothetical protein